MDPVCCLQYFCGVLKTRSKDERVVKNNSQEINLIVGPERPPLIPQFNLKVYGRSPPTFSFDAAILSRTRMMTTAERKGKVLHPWGLQAYDDFVENGTCMFHEAHRGSVDGYSYHNCCLWPQTYNSSVTYEWPVEDMDVGRPLATFCASTGWPFPPTILYMLEAPRCYAPFGSLCNPKAFVLLDLGRRSYFRVQSHINPFPVRALDYAMCSKDHGDPMWMWQKII